jgi:hypothetical protein
MSLLFQDFEYVISSKTQKQKIKKIINLDVFHSRFAEVLNNYKYDFLTKVHKPQHDDYINLIKISLKIHNAEIIMMKDNFDYL